jgi:aldose 1-epimerase
MKEKTIIIVGGGQAAAMAAASLRQQGFTGELHLFSDERHLPYERPPLSKSMLLEDSPQLQQVLPANWWQENNVHLHSSVTIKTRIQAQASGYWLEREQWLAGEFCEQLPQELDFNQPAPLPRQWVNNGFAGWNGQARIEQPQEGYAIIMETTPPAPCYFIFVSDPAFDKGYAFDFFCLEPMSHAPDDHHRPEGGDLIALAPGESTTSEMSLRVEWL